MFKDSIFVEESQKLINSSAILEDTLNEDGIKINKVTLDSKSAKIIDREKGKYITISFDRDNKLNVESLINEIKNAFLDLMEYLKVPKNAKVLFVGLGNKDVTSDKFGYLFIEKTDISTKRFKIYKDTVGITNIKSVDFIRVVSELVQADLVIVADSLKAEHLSRLGNTIQLSTGGLCPGSAISEKKASISKKSIRTNVICVGVPTIINMKDIQEENPDLLVSSKDIDRVVDNMSSLLSITINRLF